MNVTLSSGVKRGSVTLTGGTHGSRTLTAGTTRGAVTLGANGGGTGVSGSPIGLLLALTKAT